MADLFKIPITYKVFEFAYVEAETLDEAIDFVKEHPDEIEILKKPEYVDDTLEVDGTQKEIEVFNW